MGTFTLLDGYFAFSGLSEFLYYWRHPTDNPIHADLGVTVYAMLVVGCCFLADTVVAFLIANELSATQSQDLKRKRDWIWLADLGWYGWWMSLGTLLLWLMTRMAIIMQSSVLPTAPAMGLLALVFLIRCLKIRPMLRFKQAMTQIHEEDNHHFQCLREHWLGSPLMRKMESCMWKCSMCFLFMVVALILFTVLATPDVHQYGTFPDHGPGSLPGSGNQTLQPLQLLAAKITAYYEPTGSVLWYCTWPDDDCNGVWRMGLTEKETQDYYDNVVESVGGAAGGAAAGAGIASLAGPEAIPLGAAAGGLLGWLGFGGASAAYTFVHEHSPKCHEACGGGIPIKVEQTLSCLPCGINHVSASACTALMNLQCSE